MENWNIVLDNVSSSALSPSKVHPELHPPPRTNFKNLDKSNITTSSTTTKTRSPKPTLKIGKLNANTAVAPPVSPPPPSVAEIINRSAKYLLQNNIEYNGDHETSFGLERIGPAVAVIASSPEEYLQRISNINSNDNPTTATATYHHHHHFHYDPSSSCVSPNAIIRNLSNTNNLLGSPPIQPPLVEMRQNQEHEFWDEEVSPESPRNAKECIPKPSPFKQQQQQDNHDYYYSRNETNNNIHHHHHDQEEDVAVNLFSSLKTSNTSSSPPSQLHQNYSQNYYYDDMSNNNNNNNNEHYQEYVVMPKPASGRFRHQNSNYQTTGSSSTMARSPSIGEHQQHNNDDHHHSNNHNNVNETLFLHSSQKRSSSSSAAAKQQPPSKPAAIISLFQHFGGRVKYANMKDVLFCASLIKKPKKEKSIGDLPLHLLQSSQEDDDLWCELVDGLAVPYITESRFVEVLLKRRARVIHPADWPAVNVNQYSSSRRAVSSSSQNANEKESNGVEEIVTMNHSVKNDETILVKPKKKKSTNKPLLEQQQQQPEREPSPSSSLAHAREERRKTKKSTQKQSEAKHATAIEEEEEKSQIVFDDSYVAHVESQQRDENQLPLEEEDSSFVFQRQNTHHAAANCPFGIVSKNDLPPMAPVPPTSSSSSNNFNNNSKQIQHRQQQPSPSPVPNDPFTSSAHTMTNTNSTFDQMDCNNNNNSKAFTRMSSTKHTSVEVENEPFENNDGNDSSSPANQKYDEKCFSASHSPTNNNLMSAQQNQNDTSSPASSTSRRRNKLHNVNSELETAATTTTTQHLLRASYESTPLSSFSVNNNNLTPRTNKAAEARRVRSTERRLRVEKLESERNSTNFKPLINNRSRSLSAAIDHTQERTTARSQSATHKTSSNVPAIRSTSVSSSVQRETKISSVNRRLNNNNNNNNNNNTLSPHAREPSRSETKIQQGSSQPKRSLSTSSAQNKNSNLFRQQREKEQSTRGRSLSTEVRRQMADDAQCTFAPKINKFKYADEKISALHYRNSERYVESKLSKTQEQFVTGKYSPTMKMNQNKNSEDQQRRQKQRTEIHRSYASSFNSDKTVLPNEYFETVDRLRRNVQIHKDSPDRLGGSFMEKLREGKQKTSYATTTNPKRSLATTSTMTTITVKKPALNSGNSVNTSYSYADKWARQVLANATKQF